MTTFPIQDHGGLENTTAYEQALGDSGEEELHFKAKEASNRNRVREEQAPSMTICQKRENNGKRSDRCGVKTREKILSIIGSSPSSLSL